MSSDLQIVDVKQESEDEEDKHFCQEMTGYHYEVNEASFKQIREPSVKQEETNVNKVDSEMDEIPLIEKHVYTANRQCETYRQFDDLSGQDEISIKQDADVDFSKDDKVISVKENKELHTDLTINRDVYLTAGIYIKTEPLVDDNSVIDNDSIGNIDIADISSNDCELIPKLGGASEISGEDTNFLSDKYSPESQENNAIYSNIIKSEASEHTKNETSGGDIELGYGRCIKVEDSLEMTYTDTSGIQEEMREDGEHCIVQEMHQNSKACALSAKSITGKTTVECKVCNKIFKNKGVFKSHTSRFHCGQRRRYSCNLCSKSYTSHSSLKVHQNIHTGVKPFKCNHCEKAFTQSATLREHKMIHAGIKPYKCTYCSKQFRNSGYLKRHIRIHTGEKPYKCKTCGVSYRFSSDLQSHELRSHIHKKNFRCDVCMKSFVKSFELKRHQSIHTGVKPFKCQDCDKCFGNAQNLKAHVKIHMVECKFKCKFCIKSFKYLHSLTAHERVHTGEKPYKCDICQSCFRNSLSLKKHGLIHIDKQFKCKHHDKNVTSKLQPHKHAFRHVKHLIPYECNICLQKFTRNHSSKSDVSIHTHYKETFHCNYCEKILDSSDSLKMHEMIHTGETPFICKPCQIGFKSRVDLKKHDAIHTTANQIVQQKDSSLKTSRFREFVRHSSSSEFDKMSREKAYICKTCDKSFGRPFDLRIHERVHK